MRLRPGDFIGEYRIVSVIGNGGFSVVYRAEDTHLLRPVAIKQLSPEVFSEAGTREWFIREARLAASLNHPNIVATYALREEGDNLFLIMEYLPGGDLHSLIEETGPLDRATLLKVASDVCHALETLHARNVIHRDIKPENILIAEEGQFKLADFGLAHIRQAQQHSLNRAFGPQPGTLLYMSPEQALGEEITVRSDIYSLAIVLYEAMTGHYYLNYDHQVPDEDVLLEMVTTAAPIAPNRRHPSVPAEFAEVLMHALHKNPEQRPRTAREFLTEIKTAISRSKRSTLTQKRRQLEPHPALTTPELLRDLYRVRTLRDAEHQPQQALQLLQTIWETYPGVPEVAAEWGETMLALDRMDEGRDWLERAVRLKPELPFAQLALADLYRNEDENEDEADDALIQAIHADPDLAYAVLFEDIVQSRNDPATYDHYVAIFQRAAEEQHTAPLFHNLGQVLALGKGREKDSIMAFQMALEFDPDYGPSYVGLASLLIDLGQVNKAARLLEQATYRYFPTLPPEDWHKANTVYQRQHAFLALAVAYAQVNQYENSAVAACTVLDLAPQELEEDADALLEAYVQAAEDWMRNGEHLRAYKLLNQIIPLAAYWGKVEVFMLLGITQSKIGVEFRRKQQWEDAEDWLKAGLINLQRIQPHSREAQRLATEVHHELQKAQQRQAQ